MSDRRTTRSARRTGARETAQPAPMSPDEVQALAGRRSSAGPVVRRLNAHNPTKTLGQLRTNKAKPPGISKAEMARISRTGSLPDRLRERLVRPEEPKERHRPRSTSKQAPSVKPPVSSRRR